jgi:hypothetical protein
MSDELRHLSVTHHSSLITHHCFNPFSSLVPHRSPLFPSVASSPQRGERASLHRHKRVSAKLENKMNVDEGVARRASFIIPLVEVSIEVQV